MVVGVGGVLTFAKGRWPLKRRRIDESIPRGLRQLEGFKRMKRLAKCRANFFVRFFTIFTLFRGVTFVMAKPAVRSRRETR